MQFLRNATLAVGLAISASCYGQGTIYFDRSSFEFAIAGLNGIRTDVDFQSLPSGVYAPGLTISGLTFRGGGAQRIESLSAGGSQALINYDSLTPQLVDMNGPTLAFGADFSSLLSSVTSTFLATVVLNDGRVFTFIAPADPNFTFFGYVTTQPFSTLTFSDGGLIGLPPLHEEILANITVVTVPEPGVWALLALGALLLGWRWCKFSAANKQP